MIFPNICYCNLMADFVFQTDRMFVDRVIATIAARGGR